MRRIERDGFVCAIFHKREDWQEGLDFLTSNEDYIQVSTWLYNEGRRLKEHQHIPNSRKITLTQETIVVLNGEIQVDLYEKDNLYHSEKLVQGDLAILLKGGHGYSILTDNTRIVEIKNGPFVSVEKDKILINSSDSEKI